MGDIQLAGIGLGNHIPQDIHRLYRVGHRLVIHRAQSVVPGGCAGLGGEEGHRLGGIV